MTPKALSIRAPWWWCILHAGKDVENRDWPTDYRGKVYVHASSWWSEREVVTDTDALLLMFGNLQGLNSLALERMKACGGALVGSVEIVSCVAQSESPWFFGRYGFVLQNPMAFPKPVPCRGALGFFAIPSHVVGKIGGEA